MFRFPSLKKGAKFRKYVGHSSHVTNVRFNKDKSRVISIGGADHAIFQWRFIPEETAELINNTSQAALSSKHSLGGAAEKEDEDDIPEEYQGLINKENYS